MARKRFTPEQIVAILLAEGQLFAVPEGGSASPGLVVVEPGPIPRDGALGCCSVDTLSGLPSLVVVCGPEARI